ncbi:hypothetical protein AAEU29_12625 [Pseudoalteromonas sp. SSM20]|uniref:hypothetical protein n=1 Tax=Pseudoalteromonas sp. SSM20 TaxID=3139394 RepID=UPI003BA9EF1E
MLISHDLIEQREREGLYNLVVRGAVTEELLQDIKGKEFKSVFLRAGNYPSLEFLCDIESDIKELVIACDQVDWESISKLSDLKGLVFDSAYKIDLDFSCFNSLRTLGFYSGKQIDDSIYNIPSLVSLTIHNWVENDCTKLEKLESLESLRLYDSRKLENLNGLEKLEKLEGVEIDGARNLTNVDAIGRLSKLKKLFFVGCKKVESFSSIANNSELLWLCLTNCNEIDNLQFVEKLVSLDTFGIKGTTIIDGRLDMLTRLPNLKTCGFINKKHYNLKMKELKKILEERWGDKINEVDDLWVAPNTYGS